MVPLDPDATATRLRRTAAIITDAVAEVDAHLRRLPWRSPEAELARRRSGRRVAEAEAVRRRLEAIAARVTQQADGPVS